MILNTIIQIILAILLVILLLFIATMIYNYESIVNFRNSYRVDKEIIIFDGIMDLSANQWTYNTYNKNSTSFKDLTPSINQGGGAEYSYNFWLYMDQEKMRSEMEGSTDEDVVLMLRGSKKRVPYSNDKNCLNSTNGHIFVKNPLIRLKSDGGAIVVEYNTVTNPDAYRENGNSVINCSGSWMDKNKGHLGIYDMNDYSKTYDKKWFMFTLVLQEITPDNDILYKNKTSCKIYINGINVLDRVVESPYDGSYGSAAMKHNRGMLYINPSIDSAVNPFKLKDNASGSAVQIANLRYYNYSLKEADIIKFYQNSFTKSPAIQPTETTTDFLDDKYPTSMVSENRNNLPKPF
jgi:hypothetical protein